MSIDQRHIIKQLVIELEVEDQRESRHWQDLASEIVQGQLALLLERKFSEYSDPDVVHRIDSLELDLGDLSADQFSQHYCRRFESSLESRLVALITARKDSNYRVDETDSTYDLLCSVLLDGYLPWWAGTPAKEAVTKGIEQLLPKRQAIVALLKEVSKENSAIDRLSRYCDDALMARLVCSLLPFQPAAVAADNLQKVLSNIQQGVKLPVSRPTLRRLYWRTAIETAAAPAAATSGQGFLIATLQSLSRRIGVDISAMLMVLGERVSALQDEVDLTLEGRQSLQGANVTLTAELQDLLRAGLQGRVVEELQRLLAGSSTQTPGLATKMFHFYCRLQGQIANEQKGRRGLIAELEGLADMQWPDAEERVTNLLHDTPWLDAVDRALLEKWLLQVQRIQGSSGTGPDSDVTGEQVRLLRQIKQRDLRVQRLHQALLAMLEKWFSTVKPTCARERPSTYRKRPPRDLSGIHLENAGMVLVWPFIQRLFDRLELLTGQQREQGSDQKEHDKTATFKNRRARSRAAMLLQYLVTGHTHQPEYLCPLNKLLVGLTIEQALEHEVEPDETEQQCCIELLDAVIGHIPALKNTTPAEFQRRFLQRTARLKEEQGIWTLRVERDNQDLLLDQIPWSYAWIKLPWMPHPLQVLW